VGADRDDPAIEVIDEPGRLGRRPGRHLDDVRDAMLLVPGIDALRAVTDREIDIEAQARSLFEDRDTLLLSRAGVHGRLVDDDVAPRDSTAATVSDADRIGVRSGRLEPSTGVGVVTM
jgi:hypothetical protein